MNIMASDIYANIEEASGFQKRWKKESEISDIYQTEDASFAVEPKRIGCSLPDLGKRAAMTLGLLCLLLLVGLICLVFLYIKGSSKMEMEMVHLQTNYNNLTKERDQLQTNYNNLTKERDQLQTSYNNLREEKNRLQTKLEGTPPDLRRKLLDLHGEEWWYFNRSFYYISSTVKSWNESRADCQQKGADLVIINNQEEQDFIRVWKYRTWIGLTDAEEEKTWKWVDGTPLTTPRYWGKSEPNDAKGVEDCTETNFHDSRDSWNDGPCDDKKYWICETNKTN